VDDSVNKQPQLVSIMMPAYNAERYIEQAIQSVLAQSYPHWELIVVDDGSTDGTPDILARYTDTRIKVFHQANGGEASARNTALRRVKGEYVAFLDADDVYLPRHLDFIANYLDAHPDCDGVYTDGYYCDQNGVQLKALSSRRRGPFEGDIFEQMVRASDVFGAPVCVGLRSDVITRRRLEFDPGIIIGPDWDFLTLFSETASFGYVNQCTCLYRVHQTNISVRTNVQKRALSLARCREKAIKMDRFRTCSIETRAFVFYDLLINLLACLPERQAAITAWPEFSQLPVKKRAQLYRLMARKALLHDPMSRITGEWLNQSRTLNPSNVSGTALSLVFRISPGLCKLLLRALTTIQPEPPNNSPFSDLFQR
jgi:glycosyltransferase involved in cell wall biosynthesis